MQRVGKLSRLTAAPDNQRALRELTFVYAGVANVPPGALRWDRIVLDRTNQRWRDLLSLARLFLSDQHQQTSAGTIDGHALLFEMNVLFEKYVERVLSLALAGTGFRVSSQGGTGIASTMAILAVSGRGRTSSSGAAKKSRRSSTPNESA